MDFYTFLSKAGFKILIIFILWGIRRYNDRKHSDHETSHKENDCDYEYQYEYDYDEENEEEKEKEVAHQAISSTNSKPMGYRKPQAPPLPQEAAAHPSASKPTPSVMGNRKAHLVGKRKLFKNGLLMDALMKRNDYIR
ncbi:hypothetical protein ACRRVB_03805 [Candidatus Cardinium hertigii]|uniref:hypothetical protein n=1 Tax=Candidatus Cardinium hertigii TaxID=247481 RepID=UPI003D7CE505